MLHALLLLLAAAPNVVIVLTDDQGHGDLGCHGNKSIRTPNLDRLHGQSVRLTDFHVDATCSPTRSALYTGRYSSRTGIWHTIAGRSIMRRNEKTIGDYFSAAGYRTGLFGKWHLGDQWPYRAMDRGFASTLVCGGGGVGQTPDAWGNTYFDDRYWRDGKLEQQKGYCTDVFFSAALGFIEKNRDKPFLAVIATNAPHGPYNVAEKYSKPYRDKGVPAQRANFYGMIENIDENVGRLMAKLDEWKLADDTVVLFLTDNGTAAGWNDAKKDGFNSGMRGTKATMYDGGHRVPCFLRWPTKYRPRDVMELTAHIDLLPTLLDLCGVPARGGLPRDGRSLRPLLEGKGDLPAPTLFVHQQRVETPVKYRQFAVLTERWRLVGPELFDIKADPAQKADLAKKHADTAGVLRKAYDGWWDDISKTFEDDVPLVIGATESNPVTLNAHDWRGGGPLPFSQEAVKRLPTQNGWWAVDVARAGTYRFTLRHAPAEAKIPLRAGKARVACGKAEAEAPIDGGAGVTLTLKLPAGRTRLTTTLTEKSGAERGAFYVDVERVE